MDGGGGCLWCLGLWGEGGGRGCCLRPTLVTGYTSVIVIAPLEQIPLVYHMGNVFRSYSVMKVGTHT